MTIEIIGIVQIVAFLVACLVWKLPGALSVCGASLPLVGSAALFVGSIGLPVPTMGVFLLTAYVFTLWGGRYLSFLRLVYPNPMVLLFAVLVAYCVLTGYFIPRLLNGATLVYSLDREAAGAGTMASRLPLIELSPNSGNFTQSIYLISSLIFLFACTVVFVASPFSETILLRSAAITHLIFGFIDMFSSIAAVELFFEYIRTGDYAMLVGQEITGFRRLIGAAPEASAFGGVCVGLFAYFLFAWTETRSRTNFILAALLLTFTIMSLSSTAYISLAFTISFWVAMAGLARARIFNVGGSIMVSIVTVTLVLATFVLINSEFYNTVEAVLNNLVFDKLESQSGVERGDWARQSVQNFIDTGGLGVGLGSSRPNGWPTAVLGQLGVVGAVLWGIFLFMTIFRPLPNDISPSTETARQWIGPARAGALTVLFGSSLSSPQVDPGYFFVAYVAVILAHRALLKAEMKFVRSRPLHVARAGRVR